MSPQTTLSILAAIMVASGIAILVSPVLLWANRPRLRRLDAMSLGEITHDNGFGWATPLGILSLVLGAMTKLPIASQLSEFFRDLGSTGAFFGGTAALMGIVWKIIQDERSRLKKG